MQTLFELLAESAKPKFLKTLDTIIAEVDKPFKYKISFMGNSDYSQDGQLWGTNEIEITQSKTSICIRMKKSEDVHDFKSIAFIRSIDELKEVLKKLCQEHTEFFQNFGKVTVYNFA